MPQLLRQSVNETGFRCEYFIEKISLLNEQIPEDDFHITLPAGTSVADTRPVESTTMVAIEQTTKSDDLEKLVINLRPPQRSWFSRPLSWIIVVCFIVGCIFTLLLWRGYKRRVG